MKNKRLDLVMLWWLDIPAAESDSLTFTCIKARLQHFFSLIFVRGQMLKTWWAIYREMLRNQWAKKTSWAIIVLTWLIQEVLQIKREYMWFGSCPPEQHIFLSNIPLKLQFVRQIDWVPTNQLVTLWNSSWPDPHQHLGRVGMKLKR